MGRFTKQVAGWLAAAALVGASGVFAKDFLLADFDAGTNESNMGTYFYLFSAPSWYQLNSDINLTTIANAGPPDEFGPLTYKVPQDDSEQDYAGSNGQGLCGGFQVRNFTKHDGTLNFYPAAGLGIELSENPETGIGPSFNTVTGVKFKMKVTGVVGATSVNVQFKVNTVKNAESRNTWSPAWTPPPANLIYKLPILESQLQPANQTFNAANAYMKVTEVTDLNVWKEYSFAIADGPAAGSSPSATLKAGDLAQDGGWGEAFQFKLSEVTAVGWQVNADKNTGLTAVDVLVDSVVILGFDYVSPDDGTDLVSATLGAPPTPNMLISAFETNPYDYTADTRTDDDKPIVGSVDRQNSTGYYWFFYTDGEAGGTSKAIMLPDDPNKDDGSKILATVGEGTGTPATGGARINFEMGAPFVKTGTTQTLTPFVGIGGNLCRMPENNDDPTLPGDYPNGTPFTGIYFEYKTIDVASLDVEVTDDFDAVDRAADGDGEVNYVRLPGTNGVWKSATVPFARLVLPQWAKTNGKRRVGAMAALRKHALSQIKFKYQGTGEGLIAVDNVYMYGATGWGTKGSVKLGQSASAKAAGIRATYSRGVVGVNWNAAASVASGKISLINTKGRVVASAPIATSGSKITAKLGAGKLPTGMYFVRVNAKDVNGKKIVQNAPISIVK